MFAVSDQPLYFTVPGDPSPVPYTLRHEVAGLNQKSALNYFYF